VYSYTARAPTVLPATNNERTPPQRWRTAGATVTVSCATEQSHMAQGGATTATTTTRVCTARLTGPALLNPAANNPPPRCGLSAIAVAPAGPPTRSLWPSSFTPEEALS
jgi:hypothetical protein